MVAPRTLIFGASGFVGKYLVRELKDANHVVFCADLPDTNLLDAASVERAVLQASPDYVVNLAAISSVGKSWQNPALTMDVNVKGSLHLLDAVQKISPSAKILLIGSAEEYSKKDSPLKETDPLEASNPYGISKIAQENFADLYRKKYGMNIVCTRSFNHTGVGQNDSFVLPSFCKQVAQIENSGKPGVISVGNLDVIRDFSDVRDVVHVYRMLLEKSCEYSIYNVGSGKPYKIKDLLDYLISLSTIEIGVVQDPAKMRPVDVPYLCAENSRIKDFWKDTLIQQTIEEMFFDFKTKLKFEKS